MQQSLNRPKAILLLAFFLTIASVGYSQQVFLNYFTIDSNGSDIVLEWEVQAENFVKEFQLYRKVDDETILTHVSTIDPDGGLKYQYLDDNVFKTPPKKLSYELHIIGEDKVEKAFVDLIHNPTSIQRTWGSIKAMFR